MVIDASGSARVPMDASRHELPRLQLRLRLLLVFAFYLAAGKLGLSVPYTSGNISPLWPASGVALGSVLLWGFEVWPAIALAAFLVNFFRPLPVMAGLGIALGNTSSALFGGYLLRRFAGFQPSLARMRDVLSLVLLGAVVSPIVAASIGVTTLFLTHVRAWSGPWSAWRVWWLGQAMGVLIVTPLYLIGRELVSFVRGHFLLGSFRRTCGDWPTRRRLGFCCLPICHLGCHSIPRSRYGDGWYSDGSVRSLGYSAQ